MKAKLKDKLSRILSLTLAVSMALSLLLAADIFYPEADGTAYAAESSAIGTNNYTAGLVSNGSTQIKKGGEYTLGSGAKTSLDEPIKVQCLSVSGNKAVMQTAGVEVNTPPYSPDLCYDSMYSRYWGDLSDAISNVKFASIRSLSECDADSASLEDITPDGALNYLKKATKEFSQNGIKEAWLATRLYDNEAGGSTNKNYVIWNTSEDNYQFYTVGPENSYSYAHITCAPYFDLDLSKVNVSGGTIRYTSTSFEESTEISATQSISSVEEGSTTDLADVITAVTYSNGDNSGKNAQYKISVDTGSVNGTKWTAPTGLNKAKNVTLTIKDTVLNLSTTKTIKVTPRAAGSVSVEKSSKFPESVTVGDSIDLSDYIIVTGSDSGSQSDGTISSYNLSVSGDYGTFSGTTYTPANVSSARKVTITVTPSGSPVLNGATGTVDYSALNSSFEITVKPETTGWTDRDEKTDALGFHTYTDPSTNITWKYRYNDEGYILYLYTEDNVENIISDAHVLLVPSSINGVSVVGIGGGGKDGSIIPFIPTTGDNVNNTWTSIYIPSSVKHISDGAFYRNGASADIVIPGNVNQIGVTAFKESKIKSVTFNDAKNLVLNTESFADIPTLKTVAIRGNGVTIKQRVFSNATGLTQIDIPNGTKFRGGTDQNDSYAFQGTSGLSLIKIDTDTVYSNIFSGNKNLAKVIFGENVTRVHYDWSGTGTSNATTLADTVDRATYSLNGNTIFEMNKTSGGSPFGYTGALTIVGQGLDLNMATDTYHDTSDPVTAKVAYLEKHYQETEAVKTYAQGSASSITITVEDDPSSNAAVTDTVTSEQDGIEAYYDGIIFTGKSLDKDKMTVYKMFGTVQNGSYNSAEFYALRTADADMLLAEEQTTQKNSDGKYIATYTDEIISKFEDKDSVTVDSTDLAAGTVDVKVVVLLKDADGKIYINHDDRDKVVAFVYPVAVPVKAYTAENDFLENYGSYQAVIDKIDELQMAKDNLSSEVTSLDTQVKEKDAKITELNNKIKDLEGDKSDLQAQITKLTAEKETLTTQKRTLETQLSAARNQLSDTIAEYAELLGITEVNASDYTYSVTDKETNVTTDYVLVNGGETAYDKSSATEATLSDGTTKVTVYTGRDKDNHEFTFYVDDHGVHTVTVTDGSVSSDIVSSDTVSAMQHKIAAELAALKEELASLKGTLGEITKVLNGIGDLANTDSDYNIDTTKSDSEQYKEILEVVKTLAGDIKTLDKELTTSKNNLTNAQMDNTKYYNAMVLTYKTLSNENLDTSEVGTVDELISSVQEKADATASSLKNAQSQNAVYAYQIADRNLALTDIKTLLSGDSASGVKNKIDELEALIADESISEADKAVYTDQLAELNTYKTLVEKVKSKLSALDKSETDLDNANKDIESLENQIITLKGTVSSLEETVRSNETLISSLKESVSSLTSKNESQAETISSLEESISNLQTLSSEQSEQISELSGTISVQKTKIDEGTATIEELSEAIITANTQIQNLSSKNTELVGEIASLSAAIKTLKGQNSEQSTTISELSDSIKDLEKNNTSLSSQLVSLKGTLELSEEEVASLKSTVASLQKNLTALQKENEEQAAAIISLTADLKASNALASQYKMIVDTANTLLGLNLKNTDSKEEVEAAIKAYIATAISDNDTVINTAGANYKAGYSAGVASVDVSTNSPTYKTGYSVGYSAGLTAGANSSSGNGNASTIASLESQITALSTANGTLTSQNSSLTSKNAELASENKELSGKVTKLESNNSTLTKENQSLKSKNSTLKEDNEGLKKTNSTLKAANKSLTTQNSTLQSKINSSSHTTTTTNSGSSGSNSGSASVTRNDISSGSNKTNSTKSEKKEEKHRSDSGTEKKVSEGETEEKDTEIASTPVTTSGTKYENGDTVTIKKPSKTRSEITAEGQEAGVSLVKPSGEGTAFDLDGASYVEATEEQKENAYMVINYYLNHISELGDLGSMDVKDIAENSDFSVTADVLASMDVTPSAEMKEAFEENGAYNLNISSNEIEDGDLYFIVHESEDRADTFDITLETASGNELTMELKDLSPVTISKISYEDVTLSAGNEEVGGTTEAITSKEVSHKTGSFRIVFIIFGIVVICGAAAILIYSRKRSAARA